MSRGDQVAGNRGKNTTEETLIWTSGLWGEEEPEQSWNGWMGKDCSGRHDQDNEMPTGGGNKMRLPLAMVSAVWRVGER